MVRGDEVKEFVGVNFAEGTFVGAGAIVHLSERTMRILQSMYPDATVVHMVINRSGYPAFARGALDQSQVHGHVAKNRKVEDIKYWKERGYMSEALTWYVMHLDDNRLNFNVENLVNGPSEINTWCLKPLGTSRHKSVSGVCRYTKTVIFKGVATQVRTLGTVAEVHHGYDCAKMFACPLGARDFVYQYGLIRPPEYVEYYVSAEALAERYSLLYESKHISVVKKYNITSTLRIGVEDEWAPSIHDSINSSGIPFDAGRDVVLHYSGSRGSSFQFLMERDDYARHLQNKGVGFYIHSGGYIYMKRPKIALHRVILGLRVGDHDIHGCHGPGGKLDNRKRVLRRDSASGNIRDIPKKRTSSSQQRGVFLYKGIWTATLKINKRAVTAGMKSYEDAVTVAKEAYSRVNELVNMDHASAKAAMQEIRLRVNKKSYA